MIPWTPTLVLLAGLQAVAPQPPQKAPSPPANASTIAHVPKWSVYELTLAASDRNEDPYLEVDLIGVFSGPDGESIVVGGFWDGQRTFRVRFTPPVEGTWTYATVSSDPKLDGQMGSFICVPADAKEHGFVRGGVASQTSWTFDDGAPAWSSLETVRVRAPIVQDEMTATLADGSTPADVAIVKIAQQEAGSVGAAEAADDDSLPDSMLHDRLDLSMLKDADRAVQRSQKDGTIAEVELFDPSEPSTIDEAEAHRLLDYLIARYGAYPNVVWCLHRDSAQADADDGESWTALAGALREQDPYSAEGMTMRVVQFDCAAPGSGPSHAKPAAAPTQTSFLNSSSF